MKVSFTHLIAWAIVEAGKQWPGDGAHLRRAGRQAARRRSRTAQPRHRRRRRAQGRLAGADGALHQGRRPSSTSQAFHAYYEELIRKTRENNAHRRRLPGHQRHPDQPGRDRHGRLRAAPDERARARSSRPARSPTRVEWSHAAPDKIKALGVSRGDDDDLDLRPPDHPGRRVRQLPEDARRAAAGRARLLREGRREPRRRPGDRRQRPPRVGLGATAGNRRQRAAGSRRLDRHRRRRRGAAAGRAGGDLAAQGLPHARPPRRQPEPARRRRQGRPGARAGEPQPDPGADGPDPRLDPADRRRRRDPARRPAADARVLLRPDRLPDRAPLLAPAAHVAARDDRNRIAPQASSTPTASARCCSA